MATRKAILERLEEMVSALRENTTPYQGHTEEAGKLWEDVEDYLYRLRWNKIKKLRLPKWDSAFEYTGEDEEGDA